MTPRIPFVNLTAQYQSLKPEIDAAVLRVLGSGKYVLGEEVEAFEREFAAYCGVKHAVAVNSGTSALHLSLLALGVGPGDNVITTPMTFVATVAAIIYTGARPRFADVEPVGCLIDPERAEAAITPQTKAIIPVHLYGQPADMNPLLDIAARHGIAVVEDACQAHGATYFDRRVGGIGDVGCFSFYPTKNLGGVGEGGAVVTNHEELASSIRMLRDWGAERRYHHRRLGFNYRMDAIQAAVLRVKLPRLDRWNETRRGLADEYRRLLDGVGLDLPQDRSGRQHVYHVFSVRTPKRDRLQARLASEGIETGIHYPVPVHLQEGYSGLGYEEGDFPLADRAAMTSLSLPLYPELSTANVALVADACRIGLEDELPEDKDS